MSTISTDAAIHAEERTFPENVNHYVCCELPVGEPAVTTTYCGYVGLDIVDEEVTFFEEPDDCRLCLEVRRTQRGYCPLKGKCTNVH